MSSKSPRLIQSVRRAMDIINCFDPLNTQLSLSEISQKLGLNISTVHGLINTLCAYSYIDKNPHNGKYKLGLEFLVKANLVASSLDLKEIGHSHLLHLTKTYQETTHLYVLQNEQIYCAAKMEWPGNYGIISSRAGGKLPMHASASGKLFLADMEEWQLDSFLKRHKLTALTDKTITHKKQMMDELQTIRTRGYSIEDEEIEYGAYSIAAPVRDAAGKTVGTISVIGSKPRIQAKEDAIVADLLQAASEMSARLGCPAD